MKLSIRNWDGPFTPGRGVGIERRWSRQAEELCSKAAKYRDPRGGGGYVCYNHFVQIKKDLVGRGERCRPAAAARAARAPQVCYYPRRDGYPCGKVACYKDKEGRHVCGNHWQKQLPACDTCRLRSYGKHPGGRDAYLCRKHYDEAKALTCSRCTVAVYEGDMCKWHFEEPLRCPGFEFGGCGRLKASVDAEYCPACVEVKDSSWSEMEDLWSDRGPRDNRV